MKKYNVSINSISHLIGLVLFVVTTVVGYTITQSWTSLVILGGYVVFVGLSFVQERLLKDSEALNISSFGYNFLLFIKTAIIFGLFLFPGTFGNIHSENFINVFQSFLLFGCVLFLIVNFYVEKIFLMRAVSKFGSNAMLNKNIPVPLAIAAKYFSLLYMTFMFFTVIIHVLARGAIGPGWLIACIALYSIFNTIGFSLLLGQNKFGTDIWFIIVSAIKFALPFIFYLVYAPSRDVSIEKTVFANVYTAFIYIDMAILCVGFAVDIFLSYFIFLEWKNKRLQMK